MKTLHQDIHYALRQWRTARTFNLVVVLTLALSVGAAAAIFCVIDGVILRPLPYLRPNQIVSVEAISRLGYTQPASWPSYQDERAETRAFAALAAYAGDQFTVETPKGGPFVLSAIRSTDNFFQVFGVQPILGRTYVPGEEQEGKNDIVVLSYEVWKEYFDADPHVLGRAIKMDGHKYTIIGVMPVGFRYPLHRHNLVYTPRLLDNYTNIPDRNHFWLSTIARLNDGVTIKQAETDLARVLHYLGDTFPESDGGLRAHIELLSDSVLSKSRGPLWTLFGAVLAVLSIGCINVAGLMLARGVQREREMALRIAIGADRSRLICQVLTEGVLLAIFGAVGGILLSFVMIRLLRVFLVVALVRGSDIRMNWTMMCVALATAIVASVAASSYPALRLSSINPNRVLKAGGNTGQTRNRHRLRASLVVIQIALSMIMLVVSCLLFRLINHYHQVDVGFDRAHILSTEINITPTRYASRDIIANFYNPLVGRVLRIPRVRSVGLINVLPIDKWGINSNAHIAGQPPYPSNENMWVEERMVSAGYFDVFGIPLHSGRILSPSIDNAKNIEPNVVVNDAFVKKFIPPGLNPTVQHIDDADRQVKSTRIVGVIGNVRQDLYQSTLPECDRLIDEVPPEHRANWLASMQLVVRFDGNPKMVIPALRNEIHEADPMVPFRTPRTMTDIISETLIFERMESCLFSIFAGMAILLSLVGLYGLISYEVEQSTRDIGVRIALGASRVQVLFMVQKRVAWMASLGVIIGAIGVIVARKIIGIVIYFDVPREAGNLLLLALLIVAVCLFVAMLPSFRAASVEPSRVLHAE